MYEDQTTSRLAVVCRPPLESAGHAFCLFAPLRSDLGDQGTPLDLCVTAVSGRDVDDMDSTVFLDAPGRLSRGLALSGRGVTRLSRRRLLDGRTPHRGLPSPTIRFAASSDLLRNSAFLGIYLYSLRRAQLPARLVSGRQGTEGGHCRGRPHRA